MTAQVLAAGDRARSARSTWCCAAKARPTCISSRWACSWARQLGLPDPECDQQDRAAKAGELLVERSLEDEVEVLEVPLPAVLSVTTDINQPRLPTMKEILKAGKKPVTEWSLADLGIEAQLQAAGGGAQHQRAAPGPAQAGDDPRARPEEAAQALVGYLSKEGIV